MELFLQQTINGIGQGAIIALFGVGFNLIFCYLGILNIAHGTYATWGALVSYYAYADLKLPIILGAAVGAVAAGAISLAVDMTCFMPLRNRQAGTFGYLITSIGAWIVLIALAQKVIGVNADGFPAGATPSRAFRVAGLTVPSMLIIDFVVLVVVAMGVSQLLGHTKVGSSIRAISGDARRLAIVGVNTRVVMILTASLAGLISGLAGVLDGMTNNTITFDLGEPLLLIGFASVIVGGMGSVIGTVLGGLAFGLISVYSAAYISSTFRDALTYAVLLIVLLLRPEGLRGHSEIVRA